MFDNLFDSDRHITKITEKTFPVELQAFINKKQRQNCVDYAKMSKTPDKYTQVDFYLKQDKKALHNYAQRIFISTFLTDFPEDLYKLIGVNFRISANVVTLILMQK